MSVEIFVSGRLCLFGEHSDWAGFYRQINENIRPGMAIVTGIEEGIYAIAEKSTAFIVDNTMIDPSINIIDVPMDISKLKKIALSDDFNAYVAGVASYVKEHYQVEGIKITITKCTLPMKKGLSSSAAICVLVARAFNQLYDLQLNTVGEMMIAYHGEQRTKSRCGRLDQACAFGTKPVCMTFDGNEMDVEPLKVGCELNWVFSDLNAGKDTIKILSDLNKCYPFAENDTEKKVHEALGIDNYRIIQHAKVLIEQGEKKALGALMNEAQLVFDEKVAPACEEQLKSPVLHSVLKDKNIEKLIYGAKGVGSQGDGMVQFLARDKKSQTQLIDYLEDELGMKAYAINLKPYQHIKKAVIPVAGFGTRMYPATRAFKKEFLPIVDRDGLCKPSIMILLEELDYAGIEEICMIISREDEVHLNQFFKQSLSEEHYDKLPDNMKEYEKRIQKIGKKIKYVYQDEKLGFGHAVYQAKEFVNNDVVLLCLGDMIYRSFGHRNCTKQLIDAYAKTKQATISLHEVPLQDVVHYGILAGKWIDSDERLMKVTRFEEKPSVDIAKEYLNSATKKNDEKYYAVFGEYILTPSVFDELGRMVNQYNAKDCSEIQLTEALANVMRKDGLSGYLINGESYDLGIPKAYMSTMEQFAKKDI